MLAQKLEATIKNNKTNKTIGARLLNDNMPHVINAKTMNGRNNAKTSLKK